MCIEMDIFVYRKFKAMRTNIDIDDKWMAKAIQLSENKTKKEILNTALEAYVKYQLRLKLLSVQGKVKWVGDLHKMRINEI